MCFFKTPKIPDAPSAPPAAYVPPPPPSPTVLPTEVSAQTAQDQRTKQVQALRYGLASTIKTGPRGIAGNGPELQPATSGAKTTLG